MPLIQATLLESIDRIVQASARLGHDVYKTYDVPALYWTGRCRSCGGVAWTFVAVDGTITNDAEFRSPCRKNQHAHP